MRLSIAVYGLFSGLALSAQGCSSNDEGSHGAASVGSGGSHEDGGAGGQPSSPEAGPRGGAGGSGGINEGRCEGTQCINGLIRFGTGCPFGFTTCDPATTGVECTVSGPCPTLNEPDGGGDPCSGLDTGNDPANCGACGTACPPQTIATTGAGSMTVREDTIYFNGPGHSAVLAVASGGGTVTTLVPTDQNKGVFDLAADATNVYFTTYDSEANEGAVKSVPRGGGAAKTVAATGAAIPDQLVVDASSVYWTEHGGGVKQVALAGGVVTTLAEGVGTSYDLYVPSVAVDATSVYFTGTDAEGKQATSVRKVPLAGGVATTLATGAGLGRLAVDATHVYYVENVTPYASEIRKVPVAGGNVTVLAREHRIDALALDATDVYFGVDTLVWNAAGFFEGFVMRAGKDGGAPARATALLHYAPGALSVEGGAIFWANGVSLFSIPVNACSNGACR